MTAEEVRIAVPGHGSVSGLVMRPADADACLVLAHGAGAGMMHGFMTGIAESLNDHRVATLRFQFPYMEKGSKRPDPPSLAHATIRAAVDHARQAMPTLPLFAGGKSFGGRMTSQAQAIKPLSDVRGLVFVGFPLHPANKPAIDRAEHLGRIDVPMLFIQGDRDALADMTLLKPVVEKLQHARLEVLQGANHAFALPAKLRQGASVFERLSTAIKSWMNQLDA